VTTKTSPFATPAAPGAGIKWDSLSGRLVLIKPASVETGISTAFGTAEAVRADVVVLDGPHPGTTYADSLIFPKVLQGQLRTRLGEKVLGRVTTGQAKPGQSPPWILAEATDADITVGVAWLEKTSVTSAKPPF
jgi:hypothetical protein